MPRSPSSIISAAAIEIVVNYFRNALLTPSLPRNQILPYSLTALDLLLCDFVTWSNDQEDCRCRRILRPSECEKYYPTRAAEMPPNAKPPNGRAP
jgi:hypothetical protein